MKTLNNKYSRTNRKVEKWIKGLCVISIALFFLTLSILTFKGFTESYSLPKKEVARIKAEAKEDNKIACAIFVSEGEKYLSNNQFEKAQIEFSKALKIMKSSKAAYIGLTKTLVKKCAFLKENCTEADNYIDFLMKSKFISKEEVQAFKSEIKSQ